MRLMKLTICSLSLASLAIAAAPASANGHKPHKVCKIERSHGHTKKVCRWVH